MFYVVTVGANLKLSPDDIKYEIIKNRLFPWDKKKMIFRDVNQMTQINWGHYYDSRNNQYKRERNILTNEFQLCQEEQKDYVLFTTDPVVFAICRLLMKNFKSIGELIVLTKFNPTSSHCEYDMYSIDDYGRLHQWPEDANDDMDAPLNSILSELI